MAQQDTPKVRGRRFMGPQRELEDRMPPAAAHPQGRTGGQYARKKLTKTRRPQPPGRQTTDMATRLGIEVRTQTEED